MTTAAPLIEPKLINILKQWRCFSHQNAENLQLFCSAFTPVHDSLQITQQVLKQWHDKPWTLPEQPSVDSSALSNAYRELIDIQQAALEKEQEAYFRYWTTALTNSKQMINALQGVSSPQQALVAYLEANLDLARQYQEDVSEQLTDLNQIKAAYTAWWQKTLESLQPEKPQ
ncbi:hypothetical protein LX59_01650 [Azomonas agilis]|uniref:Phasin protein n=1 Tax=Azomonas agilis TaxID=116849 RepID=A0A562IKL5_9GAMM|nr:hypothetical protein [Azomonas agilis]TWH71366.1 hypothetical protein LX59_01650 [Azomonas agilis]